MTEEITRAKLVEQPNILSTNAGNGIQTGLKIQGQVSNWIKSSTLFRRTNSTNAGVVECIHSALKMLRPRGIAGSCPATGTIKKLLKESAFIQLSMLY